MNNTVQVENALILAERFHNAYESMAHEYGYTTRIDTKVFDPDSANGKLMVAVIQKIFTIPAAIQTLEAKGYVVMTEEELETYAAKYEQ